MNYKKSKVICRAILLTGILSCLAGCSGTPSDASRQEENTITGQTQLTEEDTMANDIGDNADKQNQTFGKTLWEVYQQGILQDGEALEYSGMEAAQKNSFAILDIDNDGQEELLLFWTNTSMSGMIGYIWGYGDGVVYEEFSAFPVQRFYNNGVIEADWSHNQGLAGDFWPYDVYTYDAEEDIYRRLGSVDVWDKSFWDMDNNGNAFPEDIDADGDGIIYYLLPPDWEGNYDKAKMADGAEYEEWRQTYLGKGESISVSVKELTEENIAALGCPKLDIELPEPVG